MNTDQNSKNENSLQKNNISECDLTCSCTSKNRKIPDNHIAIGLLSFAVCISFLRYITTNIPPINISVAEQAIELKTDIQSYDSVENVEDENLDDTDFGDDEEWDDDEEIQTNENSPIDTDGQITFKKGDTLAKVLERVGLSKSDVHGTSVAVSRVFHLTKIKPGLQISIKADKDDKTSLKYLEFKPDKKFRIVVEKSNKRFIAKKVTVPLKRTIKKVSGTILPKSPTNSLQRCGLQKSVAHDVLRALAQVANVYGAKSKVNFDLAYEQYHSEDGELVDSNLLAVVASVDGKIRKVYKFSVDGSVQYIDATGTVLNSKKSGSMFIKPLHYKKITSQFGYRYHPISGRGKMHTGVDLSATIGTPVRATASGCVVMAKHYSGYGRYIKLKHSGNYHTAYAHLSRIVVHPGQFVKQGQVIGYSGNSGYSTGAHLHYEVIHKNRFVNPLAFVPKPPQKLSGKALAKFGVFKKSIRI